MNTFKVTVAAKELFFEITKDEIEEFCLDTPQKIRDYVASALTDYDFVNQFESMTIVELKEGYGYLSTTLITELPKGY